MSGYLRRAYNRRSHGRQSKSGPLQSPMRPSETGPPAMKRGGPVASSLYRLSRLAWLLRRWRLRFLTDRRRRFMAGLYLGLHGFNLRSAPSGFTAWRLAVARSDQFFRELRPFIGGHGWHRPLRHQIF
jgi:hypothetical protein